MHSKFVRHPAGRLWPRVWTYCMDFFKIIAVASPGLYAGRFFFLFFLFYSIFYFILFLLLNFWDFFFPNVT